MTASGLFGSAAPRFVTRCTTTREGDFRPPPVSGDQTLLDAHRARYAGVCPHPVTWLRQTHGTVVVTVEHPGAHAGLAADAAVTRVRGAALAVVTADCAPVVLRDRGGDVVGIVHAGWRGLLDGVVGAAVEAMRAIGSGPIDADLGPCVHAECYEFGVDDLDSLTARFGPSVRARTKIGRPAADLPATVRAALAEHGIALADDGSGRSECTACAAATYFSHRARADAGRQATIVWCEP